MQKNMPFSLPIELPQDYHVHDFTTKCINGQCSEELFSIGRYNEARDFYEEKKFTNRNIHLGMDFGAPAGTPVLAVSDGRVYYTAQFAEPGDYGGVLVTENNVAATTVYCLYAHVSMDSLKHLSAGDFIKKGVALCKIATFEENGNWPPHLHFQICINKPAYGENIPGVGNAENLEKWLKAYPDPQNYFGKLYS